MTPYLRSGVVVKQSRGQGLCVTHVQMVELRERFIKG